MPLAAEAIRVSLPYCLSFLALFLISACTESGSSSSADKKDSKAIPVEVSPVETGSITRQRTFTGTLEAESQLIVAPKISGRIERLYVNLADAIETGQLVANLDNAEYVQAVNQAEAELAVAQANHVEAQSLLKISQRELKRIDELLKRSMSSESQYDLAVIDKLKNQTHVEVTRAELRRAESALESARIRLGYTRITATWENPQKQRYVAERWVDEGETVSENTPLLRIISLDPITAVFHVAERDYANLKSGQSTELVTDVFPDQRFAGTIARIAPVFRENTRQARIEVQVENAEQKLKPGMFVRIHLQLERVDGAVIVPELAITRRADQTGVFMLAEGEQRAVWTPVVTGIRHQNRIQIREPELSGRVITLGQQLLEDGASVIVTNPDSGSTQEAQTP